MMRRFTLLAAALALALVVAACSGSTPEGQSGGGGGEGGEEAAEGGGEGGGELVWAIGGAEAQVGGLHQQVAELWNEENPDTPVRVEILPDQADEQRNQQSLVLQSESPEFDLLGMDLIWLGEYSTNGWILSLEEHRAELEEVLLEGPLESAQWEGELWAAPLNSNTGFFYYRTDLIDTPPTTWDEAFEVCTAAAEEAGISAYVAQGAQYEGLIVNFLEFFFGAGGNLISEDGTTAEIDQGDAAATAIEFMQRAQSEGFFAPGFNTMQENEAVAEFQSGNAACMRNWPGFNDQLQGEGEASAESQVRDTTGIAPLPTFTGEGTVGVTGGFNTAVSAFSDNPEAATEFAIWASTNEEVQTLYGEGSLPPVRADVYEALSDDPVMELLGQVLPDARPRPPAPTWSGISEEMQQIIYPAYNEGTPVDEVVSSLQEAVQGQLEQ